MTTHRFTAVPITPIHVGDGSLLAPEDYLLEADAVARFVPERVLADMPPQERRRFLAALDAGRLGEAQAILRAAVDPERHIVERVALGGEARRRLAGVFENPLQRGEIRPSCAPAAFYLPGSSLKRALRTALVNHFATRRQPAVVQALGEAQQRERRPGDTRPRADALVRTALALGPKGTDKDPLRFVEVADAPLPPGRTRIDLVENWKPSRGTAGDGAPRASIPMQVERLLSRADGATFGFPVEIRLAPPGAARAARALDPAKTPEDAIDVALLIRAANDFAWSRYEAELEQFFAREAPIRALLEEAFRIPAGGQTWSLDRLRSHPGCMLLWLGRFTQFESKSVDFFREGWSPQARRAIRDHGATRNVVTLAGRHGPVLAPMGWLLLCPPELSPDADVPRGPVPPPPQPGTARPQPARRYRLDGEPVQVLDRSGASWQVRTADGSIEWVDPAELEEGA